MLGYIGVLVIEFFRRRCHLPFHVCSYIGKLNGEIVCGESSRSVAPMDHWIPPPTGVVKITMDEGLVRGGVRVILRCLEISLLGCAILQTTHQLDTKYIDASVIL